MDLGLDGKKVLITGGSSGIGREIVRAFMAEGANVSFTYYSNADDAQALCDEYGDADRIRSFRMDMRNEKAMSNALAEIIDVAGPPDILVNNAVVWGDQARADGLEDWQAMLRANLEGYFRCSQSVLPHMKANGWGRIVSMSSTLVEEGMQGVAAYAAAKSGLQGMTKGLAWDGGEYGVLANVVLAGLTLTERAQSRIPKPVRESVRERTSSQRLTRPEDVADLVVFLASERNGNISGQSIRIAGG
nr:short chain dehydrogenase [uncultured bacterium]